jgi:hypothetical protein
MSPKIMPPIHHTTSIPTTMIVASFKTATLSPCLALRVRRPAEPRIEVDMLEKDSEVLSRTLWEEAWLWIWSVTERRAVDFCAREERRELFCLIGAFSDIGLRS